MRRLPPVAAGSQVRGDWLEAVVSFPGSPAKIMTGIDGLQSSSLAVLKFAQRNRARPVAESQRSPAVAPSPLALNIHDMNRRGPIRCERPTEATGPFNAEPSGGADAGAGSAAEHERGLT